MSKVYENSLQNASQNQAKIHAELDSVVCWFFEAQMTPQEAHFVRKIPCFFLDQGTTYISIFLSLIKERTHISDLIGYQDEKDESS